MHALSLSLSHTHTNTHTTHTHTHTHHTHTNTPHTHTHPHKHHAQHTHTYTQKRMCTHTTCKTHFQMFFYFGQSMTLLFPSWKISTVHGEKGIQTNGKFFSQNDLVFIYLLSQSCFLFLFPKVLLVAFLPCCFYQSSMRASSRFESI